MFRDLTALATAVATRLRSKARCMISVTLEAQTANRINDGEVSLISIGRSLCTTKGVKGRFQYWPHCFPKTFKVAISDSELVMGAFLMLDSVARISCANVDVLAL